MRAPTLFGCDDVTPRTLMDIIEIAERVGVVFLGRNGRGWIFRDGEREIALGPISGEVFERELRKARVAL